ncbi:uncharacterized protein LOC658236 [Tribolium castaneum]|uniref:VWFA domain-containing protein n=1 Tax=Tribolium castaneum TaxID=7070 RepID=D6W7I5_TRICA|nr:PREDICTED: uncharacterized protein LOC658236 [Tribolium castaneum]EFA11281.1 hypothetical protein TcasGA2_TC010817 [Tribolium castaneum]|eukprot:XP_969735.1 PREDICTED: uncharacterized protein LOC658236 [Tribolium castaneum]
MRVLEIFVAFIFFINSSLCQDNAGTNLAPALQQCYNTTQFAIRDYRLPSDMTVLIDIIRRIEDGNAFQDARELSFEILHRFRQDGIRRTTKDLDSTQGIPFSPKGKESFKNRVQLKKITPGNAYNFNNDSLTPLQACSLHFMISSTIDLHELADDTVCNKIEHYTSRVEKRETEFVEADQPKNRCPVESGVVYTKWGEVKAGILFAGIAAGFQPNSVPVVNGSVDSAYASTLAGELSEVALYEVGKPRVVGNKGSWNTTIDRKYYFLANSDKDHLYLTDAEIRGSLDGLFLALNIQKWKSQSSDIKISQILDLYYGRGVFNDTARVCNRNKLMRDLVASDKLVQQTSFFNYLLDQESQYDYTPIKQNFPTFAQYAVESLRSYLDTNLKDRECSAEEDVIERVSSHLLIFVDTTWTYQTIQPIISHILKNIDVNKYETSYTIYDGTNCNTIVNRSSSILDFYDQYNVTQHQKYPTGFDYSKAIQTAEVAFKAKLDNATDLTGQSMIVLMLPHNKPTSSQSSYVQSEKEDFKSVLPDVRIIVAGSESKESYSDIATNSNTDVFTISEGSDETLRHAAENIVARLKKIPRSVVNPKCGSSFETDETSSFEITQYVQPTTVNYHKISPNYFKDGQTLKIRGQGAGTIAVCISRTDANPRANATGANCTNIESNELTRDISTFCTDESLTDCSPIYISVQGMTSNVRCTDKSCRFPNNIKYTISLENVKCSSCGKLLINNLMIFVMLVVYCFTSKYLN